MAERIGVEQRFAKPFDMPEMVRVVKGLVVLRIILLLDWQSVNTEEFVKNITKVFKSYM